MEMVENRVLAIESASENGRCWDLISLEGGMSNPNLDTTAGCKHTSATVPFLECYYPTYRRDPRYDWDEQVRVEQDKRYQGIRVEVTEGARNRCS
jgi:hypothetical protein